jgi:hypothetical protein
MNPTSLAWNARAEAHFATALRESTVEPDQLPNEHAVLHHTHACVRDFLRARLAQEGIPFPETSYLVVLLYLCIDLEPAWEPFREHIRSLTTFLMDSEDPLIPIPPDRVQDALQFCMAFRAAAKNALES